MVGGIAAVAQQQRVLIFVRVRAAGLARLWAGQGRGERHMCGHARQLGAANGRRARYVAGNLSL